MKRILALLVAMVAMVTGGITLAPQASANATWTTCGSRVLSGTTQSTVWCNSWVSSTDYYGYKVVRPTSCQVSNYTPYTMYATSFTLGHDPGHVQSYYDATNHTIPASTTVGWACGDNMWVRDAEVIYTSDGQVWNNLSIAKAGNPYQVITLYDTDT